VSKTRVLESEERFEVIAAPMIPPRLQRE